MSPQRQTPDDEFRQFGSLLAQLGSVPASLARLEERVGGMAEGMRRAHEVYDKKWADSDERADKRFTALEQRMDELREDLHKRRGADKVLQFVFGTSLIGVAGAVYSLWEKLKVTAH